MPNMRSPFAAPARLLRALAISLLALGSAAAPLLAAATTVGTEAEADPPGRVGRIADLQGQVWLYHPEDGDWIDAERNRPLTGGDRLATEAGARAEVRVGSTTLRLDAGSELEVLRLDDERIVLQLHSGSVAARLRSRETVPEFELRTGEGRFTVQRTGRYRFDREDETSHATVYSGQALYEGQGSALTINAGQKAEFWLDSGSAAQYSIVEPSRDAFAAWNAERDRADDRSASTRYVSPEMTGVEDLDRYGAWQEHDEYGALWVPRVVSPGWAPYSTGRWAWVAPWGWTWIDEAPWGFAPFHYGRWVYVGSRWCWAPGHYVRRPIYAPALVAWIGGPRLSIGVGTGPAIGWLPLAPREVYVPGYRVSPGYVRNINITHVVNITNLTTIVNNPRQAVIDRDYRNRKFPHAVTVVPAATLSTRAPVAAAARPWRDAPAAREISRRPVRDTALVAPPADLVAPPVRATPGGGTARTGSPNFRRDGRNGSDARPDVQTGAPDRQAPVAELWRDRPGLPARTVTPAPLPAPVPAPAPARAQQRDERKMIVPPVQRERREPGPPALLPEQPRERHEQRERYEQRERHEQREPRERREAPRAVLPQAPAVPNAPRALQPAAPPAAVQAPQAPPRVAAPPRAAPPEAREPRNNAVELLRRNAENARGQRDAPGEGRGGPNRSRAD